MDIANKIIRKVEESKVDEGNYEYLPKRPQHIIDEETADLIRELRKDQSQREMYDDPDMNWSGLR